jgi:inhibitor of cysteine peptidase
MKNRFFKITFVIIALVVNLVLMAGCKSQPVQLAETDNGKEIPLDLGEQLVITLPGNPSTGYSWEVRTMDTAILEQVGEPEFASDNTDLVGAGGLLTLTFEAKKAGSTSLELVYHHPWETDVEPLQIFAIQVTVK